ncbi:glycosyltransferase family 39 protein [Actinoplanes sp. NPDC049118]|uniref:ArnT family glycosyltransferase n=1 Tax=Actinoplanes sp. NPDC049118 TaxID=3155769 RepID=UPI0033FD1EBD
MSMHRAGSANSAAAVLARDERKPAGSTESPARLSATVMLPAPDLTLRHPGRAAATPQRRPRRRLTWLPLLVVLVAQSACMVALHNTTHVDEAAYLYAGHQLIGDALGRTVNNDDYAAYFSGAPFLYPVLAGVFDSIGGLAAARVLSLLCMLGATSLLYAAVRKLFDDTRAGFFAAALFGLCGPALFMSHLATFDAPAVTALAGSLYFAVGSADRRALLLEVAAVAVAAVALKYAAMVFLLPVIAVTVLVAVPKVGWRWALMRGAVLSAVTVLFAVVALLLAGPGVLAGVTSTTTSRTEGAVATLDVLSRAAVWVGPVLVLACLGTLAYAISSGRSPARGPLIRLLLGLVLTGAALIAPMGSARLHTLVSLQKHAGYGLLFAAAMAGLVLSRLAGRSSWRTGLACLLVLPIAASGLRQAVDMFVWPDSSRLVATLDRLITRDDQLIMAEEAQVPRYYLQARVRQAQWRDTYYFDYVDRGGKHLVGLPAYQAAIRERHFALFVFTHDATADLDAQLEPLLPRNGYRRLPAVPAPSGADPAHTYTIWQLTPDRR